MTNTHKIIVAAGLAVGLAACAQVKGSGDHTSRAATAVLPDSATINVEKCNRGLFSLNLWKDHLEGGDPIVVADGFVTAKEFDTSKTNPFKALSQSDVPEGALPLDGLELRLGKAAPSAGRSIVPGNQRSQLRQEMRAVKSDGREEEGETFASPKPLRYHLKQEVAVSADPESAEQATALMSGVEGSRSFLLALSHTAEKGGFDSEMAFAVPLDVEEPEADQTLQLTLGDKIEVPINPFTGALGPDTEAYVTIWIQELSPNGQPKWMVAYTAKDEGQKSLSLTTKKGNKALVREGNAKIAIRRRFIHTIDAPDGGSGKLCVEAGAGVVKLASITKAK